MISTRSKLNHSTARQLRVHISKVVGTGLLAASLTLSLGVIPANATPSGSTAQPTADSAAPDSTQTALPTIETTKATPTDSAHATATSSPSPLTKPVPSPSETITPSPKTEAVKVLDEQVGEHGAYMGLGAKRRAMETEPQPTDPSKRSLLAVPQAEPLAKTFMPAGVQGLDVSGWQPSVDWAAQYRLGARFAYVKASEGNNFTSSAFGQQYTGAANAGLLRGAYHFALPGQSSAVAQADFFVRNGGGWSSDGKTMPPLLDIEYNPYPSLGNTCYNQSQGAMVTWIKAFSNRVLTLTGRLPMIYTTTDWWQQCTGNSSAFSNQPLHVAAYSTVVGPMPKSWSTYSVWQYSSTGPFAGDSNVWNGTLENLKKFAGTTAVSAPKPLPVPSIPSPADVVTVDANGALWNYPATGAGRLGDRKQIGSGWRGLRSINVTDWNADGVLDIVAQWNSGAVTLYQGNPGGGFAAPTTLASSGWSSYQLTIGYWLNGSRYPHILTRSSTGELKLWRNNSGGALAAGTQIGQGWGALNLTMLDFDGDGNQDVLAQDTAGNLRLYRSNGAGAFFSEPRKLVGTGWASFTSVTVYSDFTARGSMGLIRRTAAGVLSYLPVGGNSTFGAQSTIGSGWGPYLIAGGENINIIPPAPQPPVATPVPSTPPVVAPKLNPSIKSASDIVTVDSAGKLWRYPVTSARVGARIQIGSGFAGVKSAHVTDWNADGVLDLVVQWTNGRLTLYRGATLGGFTAPLTLAGSGWADYDITVGQWIRGGKYPAMVAQAGAGTLTYFTTANGTSLTSGTTLAQDMTRMHPVMTDFDGDGNADIAAIDNIGRLFLYRSNGKGALISEARPIIGTGWDGMTSVGPAAAFTSSGSTGFLARTAAGALLYYPTASSGFGTASALGSGWDSNLIAGSARLTPQQAIPGVSDIVTTDANGVLWNSAAAGNGTLGARYAVGTGWAAAKTVRVVDWNADGLPDVLTQWTGGTLSLDLGLRSGGFQQRRTVGFSGWADIEFVSGKWAKGDKYPGLVGITASGPLYYWANANGGALSTGVQIGQGWGGLHIAMSDFDGNGAQDILAINRAGSMLLYRSNGAGRFISEPRRQIGSGWHGFSSVQGVNGFAGANSQGLLAFLPTGDARYYTIIAGSGWGASYALDQRFAGKRY